MVLCACEALLEGAAIFPNLIPSVGVLMMVVESCVLRVLSWVEIWWLQRPQHMICIIFILKPHSVLSLFCCMDGDILIKGETTAIRTEMFHLCDKDDHSKQTWDD